MLIKELVDLVNRVCEAVGKVRKSHLPDDDQQSRPGVDDGLQFVWLVADALVMCNRYPTALPISVSHSSSEQSCRK